MISPVLLVDPVTGVRDVRVALASLVGRNDSSTDGGGEPVVTDAGRVDLLRALEEL